MKKKKIINDPLYGFINIPAGLIFQIIEHPSFQRLRRIRQLGLSDLVYPGALHTRFHHAVGAMHLMRLSLENLRSKGVNISDHEMESAMAGILLHDVGHAPFSHALEYSILKNVPHENVSLLLMRKLNDEFGGRLDTAISMFDNKYPRPFFHQLISSQLDVDRLDYLQRDSFYTGVHEGTIGADRIIKMLNVVEEKLVVEEKGIYSVENFLVSRRLMYWQVYLHKASVAAEAMLISLLARAKTVYDQDRKPDIPEGLAYFFENEVGMEDLKTGEALQTFVNLDDFDIFGAVKAWTRSHDPVLSTLSAMIVNRKLFRVILSEEPFEPELKERLKAKVSEHFGIGPEETAHMLLEGQVSNEVYVGQGQGITVLKKNGELEDIVTATDLPNIAAMTKIVKKHYLCWPKIVSL
ncbi:phosphohydrolase [Fulvitalea axinellae]|uniref:Phosphohydrolase n=1 Tax=Fulvitalea axinellae TaxID=1182444 RepID=A0AAU9CZ69_9BACT|nr:phosphohydrolase [Fulvitalea axinellae]